MPPFVLFPLRILPSLTVDLHCAHRWDEGYQAVGIIGPDQIEPAATRASKELPEMDRWKQSGVHSWGRWCQWTVFPTIPLRCLLQSHWRAEVTLTWPQVTLNGQCGSVLLAERPLVTMSLWPKATEDQAVCLSCWWLYCDNICCLQL